MTRGRAWARLGLGAALVLAVTAYGTTSVSQESEPLRMASPSPVIPTPTPTPTPTVTPTPTLSPSPTPAEVPEVATTAWRIPHPTPVPFGIAPGSRLPAAVEGYADHASVAVGDPVRIYVSTSATRWRAKVYRMGWYGGKRGARVHTSGWRPGRRQVAAHTLTPRLTPVAGWRPSLKINTVGWRPGTYLIRLEVADHASYIPLTVRSPTSRGRLVLLTPDTTWQAYNDWGGRNLYWGPTGKADSAGRARAVTFDRPYAYGQGAGEYLRRMLPVVALAERLKLPLAYADDVDLERDPHLLDGAAGVVSMGHDEYYSVGMRTALTQARDAGTNLAFLGANAVYRRIRFEPTALGKNRMIVNYKVAGEDPLSATQPTLTTANWPSEPAADPESSLIGEQYACFPGAGDLVVADAASWIFAHTALQRYDRLPGVLGPEFDAVDPDFPAPARLDVVFQSAVRCHTYTHADATYYSTESGAGVFATGTMGWVEGLGGHHGALSARLEEAITTNVLRAFAKRRAGAAHPSTGAR